MSYVNVKSEKKTLTRYLHCTVYIYLCFEVDPMLECFLVVQRDPQIMPIINEVVLGFSWHFPSIYYSTLPEETSEFQRETKQLGLTGK